jgi:hypothetical protein
MRRLGLASPLFSTVGVIKSWTGSKWELPEVGAALSGSDPKWELPQVGATLSGSDPKWECECADREARPVPTRACDHTNERGSASGARETERGNLHRRHRR